MRSGFYDRIFLAPVADSRNDSRYDRVRKERRSKISIAWWLVPCVIVYMAVSMLVFG